jgi:hypothetical protein
MKLQLQVNCACLDDDGVAQRMVRNLVTHRPQLLLTADTQSAGTAQQSLP